MYQFGRFVFWLWAELRFSVPCLKLLENFGVLGWGPRIYVFEIVKKQKTTSSILPSTTLPVSRKVESNCILCTHHSGVLRRLIKTLTFMNEDSRHHPPTILNVRSNNNCGRLLLLPLILYNYQEAAISINSSTTSSHRSTYSIIPR